MLGSLNNDGVQDPYYENRAVQLCGRDSTWTTLMIRSDARKEYQFAHAMLTKFSK
jgi:hypothetical protein